MWFYHSENLTPVRLAEILSRRFDLDGLMEAPALRKHATAILPETYTDAVARVCAETESARSAFPAVCPWTLEQVLSVGVPGAAHEPREHKEIA